MIKERRRRKEKDLQTLPEGRKEMENDKTRREKDDSLLPDGWKMQVESEDLLHPERKNWTGRGI